MSRSLNERRRSGSRRKALGISCVSLLFGVVSCGIVDLREVSVETYPSRAGEVLPTRTTPLRVSFGTAVDKSEAEQSFSVVSETGSVEGDIKWSGTEFTFIPVAGWESGLRYRLTLSGSISAEDGREARPDIDLPFTAVRKEGAPVLTKASPSDGASTGSRAEDGAVIVLNFSEAMDERSVEDAFSLEPTADLDFTWNALSTVLTVTPRESLTPCIAYRWSVGTEARAVDGAPLAAEVSGRFATDGDRTAPTVIRTYPALFAGGGWVDTGFPLAELASGQAIVVEFSEPMDEESVLGAVRIEPVLAGLTTAPTPTTAVFIPDKPPVYGVPLVLVVSADASDIAGLALGTDYREPFTPSFPPLSIDRIETDSGETTSGPFLPDTPSAGSALEVTLLTVDRLLTITIHFNAGFDAASRAAAPDLISLTGFFPGSLISPPLRTASWPFTDTISLTWEGLERSTAGSPRLYLLSIDGGTGGLTNGTGLSLLDDVKIMLETKP